MRERQAVAAEVASLVEESGLPLTELARRVGTSRSSATMMTRLRMRVEWLIRPDLR